MTIDSPKIIFENYTNPKLKELGAKWRKTAARGIVTLPDGKILATYETAIDLYKLPGGGHEGDESMEQTFAREILEETGWTVKETKFLGITKGFTQTSYVYLAKADEDTGRLRLDERERSLDAICLMLSPDELLEKMASNVQKYEAQENDESIIREAIALRDYNVLKCCLDERLV